MTEPSVAPTGSVTLDGDPPMLVRVDDRTVMAVNRPPGYNAVQATLLRLADDGTLTTLSSGMSTPSSDQPSVTTPVRLDATHWLAPFAGYDSTNTFTGYNVITVAGGAVSVSDPVTLRLGLGPGTSGTGVSWQQCAAVRIGTQLVVLMLGQDGTSPFLVELWAYRASWDGSSITLDTASDTSTVFAAEYDFGDINLRDVRATDLGAFVYFMGAGNTPNSHYGAAYWLVQPTLAVDPTPTAIPFEHEYPDMQVPGPNSRTATYGEAMLLASWDCYHVLHADGTVTGPIPLPVDQAAAGTAPVSGPVAAGATQRYVVQLGTDSFGTSFPISVVDLAGESSASVLAVHWSSTGYQQLLAVDATHFLAGTAGRVDSYLLTVPAPPPVATVLPPLRLGQRNDGLGPGAHPRLNTPGYGNSHATSVQAARTPRVGSNNRYQ